MLCARYVGKTKEILILLPTPPESPRAREPAKKRETFHVRSIANRNNVYRCECCFQALQFSPAQNFVGESAREF